MHHFIYPSKDTYVSNRSGYADKNFGVDEILQIGTSNVLVRTLSSTKDYYYSSATFANYTVTSFTGIFTGSFKGSAFVSGNFIGSASFTSSYFSGSLNGGIISEYTGSLSGSLIGFLSSSLSSSVTIETFTGELTSSVGCLSGTATGIDTRNEQVWTTDTKKYSDRTLLQFNLDAISASIVNGSIVNPQFKLKLRVCNEYELPITYTVYALPVSQSWNMGDGYFSDGGSTEGVSWQYRDRDNGIQWYATYTSSIAPVVDFISTPTSVTKSFEYGGGTWYTGSVASQSFNYESSDINMDVTPIVLSWLSGSLPNQGFILVHSDELQSTGSGFTLKFFSRDTNTIYSPYLDVMWSGNGRGGTVLLEQITGSVATSSVTITTASAGIISVVNSGSSFSIDGGISGTFSSSTYLQFREYYVTASNETVNSLLYNVTASFTGSLSGAATYISGNLSGSGIFTSSYFSGSIGGTNYELLSTGISSSYIEGILSGSITTTGSISTFTGSVTSSVLNMVGSITGNYLSDEYKWFYGIVIGKGLTGNITNLPVIGYGEGTITVDSSSVDGPCGNTFDAFLTTGSLVSGIFSGSSFTAYYVDRKFENGILTGSWTPESFLSSSLYVTIPSGIEPYYYALITGSYITGRALGTYQLYDSTSGSFNGQFIDGNLLGGYIVAQLTGSIYTSSYSYTSSVLFSSTELSPLNTNYPFTVVIQNILPQYKVGDVVKIGVFGRKKFGLKTFGIRTQQLDYLIPEYLPSSSFYAIKDHETDEILLDFDNYTQISCEYPGGNFFVIDTTGFPQERYYRILVRVEDSGSIYTFDEGKTFKIVR